MIAAVAAAQQINEDSVLYRQSIGNVIAYYQTIMKENMHLYNGSEYLYNGHNIEGFPYFESADTLTGSVFYDESLYNHIPMHYDLVNDVLVIDDYTKNFPIVLITSRIKYFVINGYTFINSGLNKKIYLPVERNFYEKLYDNKTVVLATKEKKLDVTTSTEGAHSSYKQLNTYFIYRNDKVYDAANEKAVLDVFKSRKGDLKKFIRSNNISFEKNFEDALIRTTQYFDSIEK